MPAVTYAEWMEREAAFAPRGSFDRRLEARRLPSRVPCDVLLRYPSGRVAGVRVVATGEFIDVALFDAMAEAIGHHAHMADIRDAFALALKLENTNAPPGAERSRNT